MYTLVDHSGTVRYVGRTTRTADVRLLEHLRKPAFRELDLRIGRAYEGLTYAEARGLEQALYGRHVVAGKLLNEIRPISLMNPQLHFYLEAGSRALIRYG